MMRRDESGLTGSEMTVDEYFETIQLEAHRKRLQEMR
jgi:hypothetical protein